MRKYLSLLKYEFKTLLKDPMSLFLVFFPYVMLFLLGYLLPAILERTTTPDSNGATITLLIAFVTMLAIGGYMGGVLLGFSLLENRDEKTLLNIAVSPVTVSGYTIFKIIYSYVIGVFGNIIMVGGLALFFKDRYVVWYQGIEIGLLDKFTFGNILVFSVVSALFVPMIALVMPMIAKNKIEGFAMVKMGGLLVMIPILALLDAFLDWKQYLLGIVPLFWPVKALLNLALSSGNPADLAFWQYMVIGTIYPLILGILCFRLFIKKTELK
jgi:fluoroquinolone transport system permease protein